MRLLTLLGASLALAGCATTSSSKGTSFDSKLPALEAIIKAAKAQPWGAELSQIPATVIEVGELESVPYLSFAGKDIELNVYGDPAHPAGLEIGTKSEDAAFRAGLKSFIAGLIPEGDRPRLDALAEGKREEVEGLALEITPPTAADAFGAWWVTASHPIGIAGAKATVGELAELAQAPKLEFDDTVAFPDVGAARGFYNYPRFRPAGKKVYATSYYKQDGVYHRR